MNLSAVLRSLVALAVGLTACGPLPSAAAETVFFVVRHAEKASETGDPPLTAEGAKRAEQLKQTLEHLRIDAVYHTERLRSRETAGPLASTLKIAPTLYDSKNFGRAWTDGLLAAEQGKRVLIVGHSETVPSIVGQLSGQTIPDIGNEYDNLFVVTVSETGRSVIRLKFGTGK